MGINLNINYHNFSDAVNADKFGDELDLIFTKKLLSGGEWSFGYILYWDGADTPLDFTYFMISFIL